jgi:pimeloyl-ACP methyl ester carboxylesterase
VSTSRFTSTDGVSIAYCLRGRGTPLYICHGGPFGRYDLFISELAELTAAYALVFHDYRGSGSSGAAPPYTYTFDHLADDLQELRQHLGHEEINVLAHSMGVWVALKYALAHSEHLNQLVLVGGSPVSPKLVPRPMARALGPIRLVRTMLQQAAYTAAWSWRASSPGARRALVTLSQITQEGRREFRDQIASRPIIDNDDAPQLLQEVLDCDLRPRLRDITAPTLVLYGSKDAMGVVGAEEFKRLPKVRFRRLEGVGHEVFIEDPEDAIPAVKAFLDRSSERHAQGPQG